MSSLITAGSDPLNYSSAATIETFDRADGYIAGPTQRRAGGIQWRDGWETQPTEYTRAAIVDGGLETDPDTLTSPVGTQEVNHVLIAAPMGRDDNGEIELSWYLPDHPDNAAVGGYALAQIAQVAPCAGVDFAAADPLQMGECPISDLSLNFTTYCQNVFSTGGNVPNIFDYSPTTGYYNIITSPVTTVKTWGTFLLPGRHWWRYRRVDGMQMAWLDGQPAFANGPVAQEAWSAGRDMWGIHIIGNQVRVGQTIPASTPPTAATAPQPAIRVDRWQWQPCDDIGA